jgi:hypothetical protein
MRPEKQKAIALRKSGQSYSQVGKYLNIPKSTLSYWFTNLKISREAQALINTRSHKNSTEALIKRNKQQTVLAKERATVIRKQSEKEVAKLTKNTLFISGISLYWAEGYKKGAYGSKWKSVDFANSDPEMISIMMKFFVKFCNISIDKIRAQVIAHENVNINSAVKYWSRLTKISANKFIKTSLPKKMISKNRRKNSNLTHGTLHIRINDVRFFFKIIGWIDGLKKILGP